jgi:hypothetical protein
LLFCCSYMLLAKVGFDTDGSLIIDENVCCSDTGWYRLVHSVIMTRLTYLVKCEFAVEYQEQPVDIECLR